MKTFISAFLFTAVLALPALADTGARGPLLPDGHVPGPNPVIEGTASINEGFEDITTLPGAGWFAQNNSSPLGTTGWFQGNTSVFSAHAGPANSYLAANFSNTAGAGTISNWMLTPEIDFGIGAELSFFTRRTTSQWTDRLEVRLSTNGSSTNVGSGPSDVGDFTTLLTSINPNLVAGGYPDIWTQFILNNSDGIPTSGTGRIAFRYYVTSGGPAGDNSDYIGIDTVTYEPGTGAPAIPEFTPVPVNNIWALSLLVLLLAGLGVFVIRRMA